MFKFENFFYFDTIIYGFHTVMKSFRKIRDMWPEICCQGYVRDMLRFRVGYLRFALYFSCNCNSFVSNVQTIDSYPTHLHSALFTRIVRYVTYVSYAIMTVIPTLKIFIINGSNKHLIWEMCFYWINIYQTLQIKSMIIIYQFKFDVALDLMHR